MGHVVAASGTMGLNDDDSRGCGRSRPGPGSSFATQRPRSAPRVSTTCRAYILSILEPKDKNSTSVPGRAGFEVALLGDVKCAPCGQAVVRTCCVMVARNVEQVRPNGVDAVVPGKRWIGLSRGKLL